MSQKIGGHTTPFFFSSDKEAFVNFPGTSTKKGAPLKQYYLFTQTLF